MPAFPRDELEEMIRRFVAANDEAGETGDWSKMSRFYTEDAVYSWNNGAELGVRRARPQADPRLGVRHRDGRPRALGLPVRAHAGRRPARAK